MSFDLRRERFERGLTIAEVANGSKLSRATIIRLEQGATPNARTAKALADFLGVDVGEVAGLDSPESEDLVA